MFRSRVSIGLFPRSLILARARIGRKVRVTTRKRTIVRVETNSLSVIHPAGSSIDVWCEECAAVVPMITPEHAARLTGATVRVIYRRIEAGNLHFAEAANGLLLVCSDSLEGMFE